MAIPAITSSTTATADRFAAFSYQITASGTPTSFAATDLPVGFSIDTGTGLITADPVTLFADDYVFTITATNGDGTSPEVEVTLTVEVADTLPAPRSFSWQEIDYLNCICCALQFLTGSGNAGGIGASTVPGGTEGSGATPVVIAAGMLSLSITVSAGTIVLSGAGTEFDGSPYPAGSYNFATPGPGYTFPEITITGDADAVYVVGWTHI